MAEFQEVVREFNRMCKSNDSGTCENCFFNGKKCESYFLRNPQETEEIIMQWAKEHPVRTNADKFREVFGVSYKSVNNLQFERSIAKFDNFWKQEYKEPSEV